MINIHGFSQATVIRTGKNIKTKKIDKINKQIVIIGNSIENRIGVNNTIPITNKIQFKISFEFIISFPFCF